MKNLCLVCSLVTLFGCGGGGGSGGGGGGGGGGTGGAASLDGVELTYEGSAIDLPNTTNVCNVTIAGSDQAFATEFALPTTDPKELLLQFLTNTPNVDLTPLTEKGNVTGLELTIAGGFDLVDLTDDLRQVITDPFTCKFDLTYLNSVEDPPGFNRDAYQVSFTCASVGYGIVKKADSTPTGTGTLTDFSGKYKCYVK